MRRSISTTTNEPCPTWPGSHASFASHNSSARLNSTRLSSARLGSGKRISRLDCLSTPILAGWAVPPPGLSEKPSVLQIILPPMSKGVGPTISTQKSWFEPIYPRIMPYNQPPKVFARNRVRKCKEVKKARKPATGSGWRAAHTHRSRKRQRALSV